MFSKKWCIFIFCFLFLFLGFKSSVLALDLKNLSVPVLSKENKADDTQEYVPGEVIVKFRKDKIDLNSKFSLSGSIRQLIFNLTNKYETKDTIKSGNVLVLKLKEEQEINEVLASLRADSNVEYVEPNYYYKLSSLSINDTYKTSLWGLENTGQTLVYDSGETSPGVNGVDIKMGQAWALSLGTTEVIVAVLDTGVAYEHPDLIANMWNGVSCKDENGDVLGNCIHGYDYVDDDKDPAPSNHHKDTHGTHVSGTVAATRNNNQGIAGVAPNIKIMAMKVGYSGMISSVAAIKSIDFAIQNGAKVINASYGGPSYSASMYDAITRFRSAGGIFVASAGNESKNNDVSHSYPSDYNLDNIISVAAIDQGNSLADFSNWGDVSVDIGAPGTSILSSVNFRKDIIQNFSDTTSYEKDIGSSWAVLNLNSGVTFVATDVNALVGNYLDNSNYYISSTTSVDLSVASGNPTQIFLTLQCNDMGTTLGGDAAGDYLALEVSGDGIIFTEIARWNEASISMLDDNYCGSDGCIVGSIVDVENSYLTSNFMYRFHWVTDSSLNTSIGCLFWNMKMIDRPINGVNAGYDFEQGTSMAAPHVAGLAGYLWSIDPTASMNEIIDNILNTGDTVPALIGKTTTGRRINAYNAVLGLGITILNGPLVTGLSNDLVPTKSKTFTWSSETPETDGYRFLIDQSISGTPAGAYSVGNTSTTYSSGNGTFYIHVQAQDASLAQGPVSTASFILDNTGPVPTFSSSSINSFVLSFGETLFDSVGQTIPNGFDLSSKFSDTSEVGISSATYNNGSIVVTISGTPLAGSKITLIEGSENKFYDNLINPGNNFLVIFDGSNWLFNPGNLSVLPINIPELIVTGELTLLSGSSPESALSIVTSNRDLFFSIGSSGAASSIGLTAGTIISESNDSIFDANLISGTEVDVNSVSNLEAGYLAQKVIQWGIPGTTLKFSQPIQVRIFVGSAFDGQVMNIYRSPQLSSNWTNAGLSSVNCTISGGYCAFAATEASYYAAAISETPSPTLTPNPSLSPSPTSAPRANNNSNQESSPQFSGPVCKDTIPFSTPDLFRISTTKGSAKIFFTPIKDKITGYAVMYGFKKGDERFAAMFSPINNNEGEQNFTINKLNPKATYYFKVTAYNGCVSGPWSDWIPAKADRKRQVHKYKIVIKDKIKTLVNQFK